MCGFAVGIEKFGRDKACWHGIITIPSSSCNDNLLARVSLSHGRLALVLARRLPVRRSLVDVRMPQRRQEQRPRRQEQHVLHDRLLPRRVAGQAVGLVMKTFFGRANHQRDHTSFALDSCRRHRPEANTASPDSCSLYSLSDRERVSNTPSDEANILNIFENKKRNRSRTFTRISLPLSVNRGRMTSIIPSELKVIRLVHWGSLLLQFCRVETQKLSRPFRKREPAQLDQLHFCNR